MRKIFKSLYISQLFCIFARKSFPTNHDELFFKDFSLRDFCQCLMRNRIVCNRKVHLKVQNEIHKSSRLSNRQVKTHVRKFFLKFFHDGNENRLRKVERKSHSNLSFKRLSRKQ